MRRAYLFRSNLRYLNYFLKGIHHFARFQPGHPTNRTPVWMTANEALQVVKSNQLVFVQMGAATPTILTKALAHVAKTNGLKGIKTINILSFGATEYNEKEFHGIIRTDNLFAGADCRQGIAEGRSDYNTVFLSEVPLLFKRGIYKPDIALVQVTQADKHGYHSLNTSIDTTPAAMMSSKYIIGQVNRRAPRTFGDGLVHTSHFDVLVEGDAELPELPIKDLSDEEKTIGKSIAENLIEDGATLQMGIGNIPDAVLKECGNHKDLGIHTEMFSDGVVDLFHTGAITNRLKAIEAGRILATFVIGTRKVFDFIDNNVNLIMKASDYVNNQDNISQNPKVTAINSCIEIDMMGNIAADTLGTKIFSGFGGQVDFLRGAALGRDGKGKPIIAINSLTNKGESKITPFIKSGAGITSTRAHVHYVVTEYGIVNLFGKNYRQRAHALISISHPKHREALEKAAFQRLKCMPSPD